MDSDFPIGELAKRTGYSTAMIRYFEKAGVVSPASRTGGGYRLFGPQHIKELQFIREMQHLGFHTPQIKAMLNIKRSELPLSTKKEALNNALTEHATRVKRKSEYFNLLNERISAAAADFADRILESEW